MSLFGPGIAAGKKMNRMKLAPFAVALMLSLSLAAQPKDGVALAAKRLVSTLDDSLKAKAVFAYDHPERFNWHFVPRARNGISFHDMNDAQAQAAIALLKASLSTQGYHKAMGIVALEHILRQVEKRGNDDTYRDALNYHFTLFGTPEPAKPWGWRIEGHHLSLNFTAIDGQIRAATPSFMGANPATIPIGLDHGKQVLRLEADLGFLLVNSLSSQQLRKAWFSKQAPSEIITGNDRDANMVARIGIPFTELDEYQKKVFLDLIDVYVRNYEFDFSERLMDKIRKAGIENLTFAWAGSLQPGTGHYYRIHGPMLLIEYDNIQNNANHIHTVVRDLTNDFAEDILREHYEKAHH